MPRTAEVLLYKGETWETNEPISAGKRNRGGRHRRAWRFRRTIKEAKTLENPHFLEPILLFPLFHHPD